MTHVGAVDPRSGSRGASWGGDRESWCAVEILRRLKLSSLWSCWAFAAVQAALYLRRAGASLVAEQTL